jgi:hypothetical protein
MPGTDRAVEWRGVRYRLIDAGQYATWLTLSSPIGEGATQLVVPTQTPRPANVLLPGETATIGGVGTVGVSKVSEHSSYPGNGYADRPGPGDVFLQAWAVYSAELPFRYNALDWDVFIEDVAVDGYPILLNQPMPRLGSGELPSGRRAEGWLVFEVPAKGEVRLVYHAPIRLDPEFEWVLRPN